MAFLGLKSLNEKEAQVLTFDGKHDEFKPGEVKIVEESVAFHANKLSIYKTQSVGGGLVAQHIKRFKILPLDEALAAGAKLPESQSMKAARAKLEADKAAKGQLFEEFKAQLQKEGWQPPKGR
jgi:hypothetical protein